MSQLIRARARARPVALGLLVALVLGLSLAGCQTLRKRRENRPLYKKVSPAVANAMALDSPDVLILDLRRPDEFQGDTGHVRKARNYPLGQLPRRMIELGAYRDTTLLVYCRGTDTCGEEGMALLLASGFQDAILIDGGIDRWIHDGFKTVLTVE